MTKLSSVIVDGRWRLPPVLLSNSLVAASIANITLPMTPLLDKKVWLHSLDGVLTAKQAYLFLQRPPPPLEWSALVWRQCIPPSHSFVYWRLIHRNLPTDEHLQARGCTLVSVCVLRYRHDETSSHLFLSCDFAVGIWTWLGSLLHCTFDLQSAESLLQCIPSPGSSQVRDVFVASIVHAVHIIWIARNVVRFGNTKHSLYSARNSILASVSLSGSLSAVNCTPSDTSLLENLCVPLSFRRYKDIVPVVWKAPTANWIEVNTDGSVQNTMAACGEIFRDHRGTFMGCFASNLGSVSVLEAELTRLILAMEYAGRFQWHSLWLESDSTSAVLAFKNSSMIPFRFRNRWHNCFQLGITVICSHIYREGNCCADLLATIGHRLVGSIWFDSLPSSMSLDFFRERHGLPNFRFP